MRKTHLIVKVAIEYNEDPTNVL